MEEGGGQNCKGGLAYIFEFPNAQNDAEGKGRRVCPAVNTGAISLFSLSLWLQKYPHCSQFSLKRSFMRCLEFDLHITCLQSKSPQDTVTPLDTLSRVFLCHRMAWRMRSSIVTLLFVWPDSPTFRCYFQSPRCWTGIKKSLLLFNHLGWE